MKSCIDSLARNVRSRSRTEGALVVATIEAEVRAEVLKVPSLSPSCVVFSATDKWMHAEMPLQRHTASPEARK